MSWTALFKHNRRSAALVDESLVAGYVPEHYWEERHLEHPGNFKAVAHRCLDEQQNAAQYSVKQQRIEALIRRHVRQPNGRRLLDAGCGIGLLTPAYVAMGFEVTAVDLSPAAIAQAKAMGVQADFRVGRLSEVDVDAPYDVICAVDVLLHIVDPDDWHATLAAFARQLAPDGILIVLDWLAETTDVQTPVYSAARSVDCYATALGKAGLRIDHRDDFVLEHEDSLKTLLAIRHLQENTGS